MIKTLIMIAICLLSMPSFAQSEKATQTTFGRYGADCSSGRGACSFTVSAETKKSDRNTKKASYQSVTLELDRTLLTADDQLRIAGKLFSNIKPDENPQFIQQEPLTVDKISLKNLEINPTFNTIRAGNYPMQISKDKVTIVFTLSSG